MKRLKKEVRGLRNAHEFWVPRELALKPLGHEWEITVREPDKGGYVNLQTYLIPCSLAPLLSAAYHLGRKNQQKAIKEELGIRDGNI